MTQAHYQANFTKAPLLLPESRIVADLLLKEITPEQWREAIQIDNVLQKRSPTTAVTQAGLIRNRLQTMQRGLWQIIRDSANPDAVQALFAATIKYSPLIADFLDQVVRQELHRLSDTLRPVLWDRFIDDCELRDPAVAGWSASTREKLRQNAFQMLAEVGIISDTRNRQLRPLTLAAAVRDYLCEHHEHDILRCLELNP